MSIPQQDRSRETQRRLLSAAIEVLADGGWAASTVAAVATRAGVSRGAAQHHFPTREILFTAAIDHLFAERAKAVEAAAARIPANAPSRTRLLLDELFSIYRGPYFRASVAIWSVASADAVLAARVRPIEARLGRGVHRLAVTLLGADESRLHVRTTIQATLDFLRGLALAELLADDSIRRARMLDRWAEILDEQLTKIP